MKLGDICKTSSGGTPQSDKAEYYGGNILWFQSGEVCKRDLYKSEKTITELGFKNSSAKIFPKNTVLMAMYGATAGQVGILRVEATTNQAICGILPCEKIIPEFLYYYLLTQDSELKGMRLGGGQPNLTQDIIKNIKISVPPLEIQQEIVSQLDTEIEFIKQTEKVIEKQQEKIKSAIARLWQENEAKITPIKKELPNSFDLLLEKAVQPFPSKK
jgi:restriction endonuclease S subunit